MSSSAGTCQLCRSNDNDELMFGELLKKDDVTIHYFCLLFAPALYQRGSDIGSDDSEGICGFLLTDIRDEIKRVRLLSCKFCRKKHANLGCSVKTCRFSYHLNCGRRNNVSFEFQNHFPTYCQKHRRVKEKKKLRIGDTCGICFEIIDKKSAHILIPCCKNSWFHQQCLQKFANSAGVFFKCPLCNDKTKCIADLPRRGIFIPEKDADWELESDAFEDFLEEADKVCDSENCLTMDATAYSEAPWRWKFCSTCGASTIHEICMCDSSVDFVCRSCTEILSRPKVEEVKVETPKKSPEKRQEFKNFAPWFSKNELVSDDDEKPEITPSIERSGLRSQASKNCGAITEANSHQKRYQKFIFDDDDSFDEEDEEEKKVKSVFEQLSRSCEESCSRQLKHNAFFPLFSDDEVLSDDGLDSVSSISKRKADESYKATSSENAYQMSKKKRFKRIF